MQVDVSVTGQNIALHDTHSLSSGRSHYKIRNTLLPVDLNVFKCYLSWSDWAPPPLLSLCFYYIPACWISTSSSALSDNDHLDVVYKYITPMLARQMTCHVPWSPRDCLPLITPRSHTYFSLSPPLSKHIENMAEALFECRYCALFGYLCRPGLHDRVQQRTGAFSLCNLPLERAGVVATLLVFDFNPCLPWLTTASAC